jgi:4-hydroxythreonine-4-phosphate dehydrogenase
MTLPAVVITSGEPAGIGPDLCLALAEREWPCRLLCLGNFALLRERAAEIGSAVSLERSATPVDHRAGALAVGDEPLAERVEAGRLNPANAAYVLALLKRAVAGCQQGEYAAMVTAPVQKSVINEAGVAFSGHTEFLAACTGTPRPVMLLVADRLRVALATTHLPLAAVPAALSRGGILATLTVLDAGLRERFGLARPRILVCGLNPHAGENGHLGHEEDEIIRPALEAALAQGITVRGPVPADTAFLPRVLADADAVLAMYHDQGLPVLKHAAFGHAVNLTLGLPILRTSVDHGTALDIAGTGRADAGSLCAALKLALDCAAR